MDKPIIGASTVRKNAAASKKARGNGKTRRAQRRAWSLFLLLSVAGCQNGLDLWGPTIAIEQARPVGLAPTAVLISASDNGGVAALSIKQKGASSEKLLLNQVYSPAAPSVTEELLLSAVSDISSQNQILLIITARDPAGHTTSQEVAIPFNEKAPEVSVISAPSSLKESEPAVAIIQAKGDGIESAGLMFGSNSIPGIRLKSLKVGGAPDQFLTLFSAPSEGDRESLRAFARNSALNTHSVAVPLSVQSTIVPDKRIRMKEDEIAGLIASTTSLLRRETKLLDPSIQFSNKTLHQKTAFGSFFGPIFEINKSTITRLLRRKSMNYDHPESALLKPNGDLLAPFGSRITILADDIEYPLGSLPFEVREVGGLAVESVGEGRVLFNENLGPLGSVVGVDMGMGVVITYGLLESSPLSLGARVLPRTTIGVPHHRASANFGTYLFGVFIGGRPANPAPFSDEDWFESTIGKYVSS